VVVEVNANGMVNEFEKASGAVVWARSSGVDLHDHDAQWNEIE